MAKDLEKTKITPVNAPDPEIGIDTSGSLTSNIIAAAKVGALDTSSIDALTNSAQTREQTYELLDAMAQDDVISAVLEVYAEDTVQQNDNGDTVWIECSDPNILDYTTWLMDSLNIQKHLYQWAYCLVTYGDVYVRLYRRSDRENDELFKNNTHNRRLNEALDKKEPLSEEAKLVVYQDNDPYETYVEMVPNPGEMFDLQKFGKTYGYIQAPVRIVQQTTDELYNYLTRYKMNQRDVKIYDATSFVHACLENTTQRQPETVDIYLDNARDDLQDKSDPLYEYNEKDQATTSYSVKRGQSILYNSFRIWRELNLLEMSALLNRITQSSVIRVLNVDVGDMSKEQVDVFLSRLKDKVEQKTALNTNTSMNEYTNPGPIINTIYVPTHGGQGTINATTIGGDFDPKSLTDIEYFRDKLFGCLRGTTEIRLSNGTTFNVAEAAKNPENYIGKEINTCNIDGTIEKSTITNVLKTRENAEFIRFTLEDDSVIEVTPEHLMMLTDGSYKEAQYITEEDELMSI